ncbi:DUF2871 domain-containing protein [uncultured Sphaerochaeta sp.]|uniref:DUF2871 domain-containing protein n=1 Tax=uncultured Sphaerochaeta sp. TaxID=886478 RepID=UPI002A0A4ECC|nr:DUF2871 domain-containing protein [uncultured Sphaerochaeta sp.]
MKKLYYSAFISAIIGLALGVFYREYTKLGGFTGVTTLSLLHVHTLVLGCLFFLIVLALDKLFALTNQRQFLAWFICYHIGLWGLVITLAIRGIMQVNGTDMIGFNHIAGTFHTILGIGLIWFFLLLNRAIKTEH